jgi:hypothetical protein
MKLKLSAERDIAILDILEDVSLENVPVLRAGIAKLLSSGKNKIILNLVEAKVLALDVIKEIVKLHQIAAELKGNIVLVGQGAGIKEALRSFPTPPSIKSFSTREAALASFDALAAAAPPPNPDSPASTEEIKLLRNKRAKLDAINKSLKAKVANRNVDEFRKLRFENAIFQQQLTMLEDELRFLQKDNKPPFELESTSAKIKQLEVALNDFLKKLGLIRTAKPTEAPKP